MTIVIDRYVKTEKEFEVIRVGIDNYLEVGRLIGSRYVTVMHDLQEGIRYIEYRGSGALIKTHIGGHVFRELGTKQWNQLNEEERLKHMVPKGYVDQKLEFFSPMEFAPPYDR